MIKKTVALFLALVMVLSAAMVGGGVVLQPNQARADDVVTFHGGLNAVIHDAIGKPYPEPIYASELLIITSLIARDADHNIGDLSGLEYCTNLQVLDFGYNGVSDLSPLAGLTNLQSIAINGKWISDLSPLAGLTNLQTLNLFRNQIIDISPLAGLTSLQYLDVRGKLRYLESTHGRPVENANRLLLPKQHDLLELLELAIGKASHLHLRKPGRQISPHGKVQRTKRNNKHQDPASLKRRGTVNNKLLLDPAIFIERVGRIKKQA